MMLLTRLRQLWSSGSRRRTKPGSGRRTRFLPLRLEALERRLVLSDGTGAGTTLVKDFIPGSASSSIYEMADLSGTLLLSVQDGGSGYQGVELWKSDGTSAGTTVVAGVEALSPFTVIGGTAFFEGEDATTPDFELFKTDGTSAGTVWVNPGTAESHPENLTNVNGTLFFSAYDPAHGFELWKSDGTAGGTVQVKDIDPGSAGSFPVSLTNVNGTLFFVASDGTAAGAGLWKSDGTAAGTTLVQALAGAANLTNVNGKLFFSGNDGSHGWELWESDGTAHGTKMVKDIYSGSTSYSGHGYYGGHFHYKVPNSSNPSNLINVNGTLFFTANDGTHGSELWKSDGTSKGTVLVSDINPGGGSSSPSALTNRNGTLFFAANDGASGQELWKSDGTTAGTVLVKDINPGGAGSSLLDLINANGTLYFQANDGTHGPELWKSDGTAAGTALVKDINPGGAGSYPALLTMAGGHLFFTADDGVHGTELWDPPIMPTPGGGAVPAPGGSDGVADVDFVSLSQDRGPANAVLSAPGPGQFPVADVRVPTSGVNLDSTILRSWFPLAERAADIPPAEAVAQARAEAIAGSDWSPQLEVQWLSEVMPDLALVSP